MIVLVSGSRHWKDEQLVIDVLSKFPSGTTVVHGDATGADTIAHVVAEELGFKIVKFPVSRDDWKKMGKAAGPIRNKKMLLETNPDVVVAFLDESAPSPGTKNMIKTAESYGYEVIVINPTSE